MKDNRALLWPAALLLFSFVLQAGFVMEQRGTAPTKFFRSNSAFDSSRFIGDARIIENEGFLPATKKIATHPVYPLLIAAFDKAFGDDSLAFLFFQCLLNCASFALVFYIAHKLFGYATALVALAACALYGPFVLYAAVYLREGAVMLLSLSVVALFLSADKKPGYSAMAAAGAVAALLMLTRPYPLSILAIVALLAFNILQNRGKKDVIRMGTFLAGYAAITLLVPGPENIDPTGPLAHFLSGNVLDSGYGYIWLSTPIKERILAESHGSSVAGISLLLKEIAAHPYGYSLFYAKKLRMLVGDFEIPSNYNFYLFRDELSRILWIPFLSFGLAAPFSFLGIWAARHKWRDALPLYLWLAISSFGVFIFLIQDRYRISLAPFFIIFAAHGAQRLYDTVKQGQRKKAFAYMAALATAFYFCRFDYTPLAGAITAEDYVNLEMAYHLSGDDQNAKFFAKKIVLLKQGIPAH